MGSGIKFTIHNASIKTINRKGILTSSSSFTIHNASIKTIMEGKL